VRDGGIDEVKVVVTSAPEELDKVTDLCGRIDWTGVAGDVAGGVLEPVASFLGADSASFRWLSLWQKTPKPITVGIADSVNEAYVTRYYKLDPARRLIGRRLATPLFASPAGRGEWSKERATSEKLEHYREEFRRYRKEFLLPSDFYHHVGFCMRDTDGRTLLFDFHRRARAADFNRLERARARLVAHYLHAKTGAGRHSESAPARDGLLSSRETEVADAVASGLSNKEVALTLDISVRTVENHMRSIFDKLGVTTRTRLAAKLRETMGSSSATPPSTR
jgi:DNA-binding CsgD family transcriptional regulator